MFYGGERNVPGAPGNLRAQNPPTAPGSSPYAEPPRNYLQERYPFAPQPQQQGAPVQLELPLNQGQNLMAGSPSFDINRAPGALGGGSGEQLKRLYEGGTQQNEQLNEELRRRGIMPGSGPQLPLARGGFSGPVPMGNAGFFAGPQYGQQVPPGFQNKIVS